MLFLVLLSINAWADRVEKVIEESFILDSAGSFSLTNVAGDIMVYSWDKEEVKMVATKSISSWGIGDPEEFLDNIEIEIVSQPKNLRIHTRYPTFSWIKNARVDYRLWIPEATSVRLESVSGTIQIGNHLNQVDTKTVSGNIKLRNIRGNIEAKTTSGEVSGQEINGDIKASSVSGGLAFLDSQGGLSYLHTTSGKIRAELKFIDKDASGMSLSTVSGDITLYLPEDASFDLNISTVSGEINSGFKVLIDSVSKRRLQGEVGDGGINIELKTVSGDISLRKL
jgi:DUF4097 and DUF4098 domain-containing protein YvlB